MSEYKCPKCNSTNLFTRKKDTQTGLYCKECGRWIKWLNKEVARVFEGDAPDTNVGSKWISVEDRLPEETQGYLVVLDNEDVEIILFNSRNEPYVTEPLMKNKFIICDNIGDWHITDRVTHWMPLPEPPKEE